MKDTVELGAYMRAIRQTEHVDRKTLVYTIAANSDGGSLGRVAWFGRWRQYTFDPMTGATFNNSCLRSLAAFLEQLNREHTEALAGATT